ncbi:MAG: hypothetical protein M1821_010042 [Bathelium mastoideum]|nr:MAG: hypothetical protein M1821_010042 [Bathelium mastoideum]
MANTMMQPVPGLEVMRPDEDMELSSDLGTYAHDDIDIDIDLIGSGMGTPLHNDDSMIEDYKNEVDMDATLMENDTIHDDEVMGDDSKPQDSNQYIDTTVHEEDLLDLVDYEDDIGAEDPGNASHQAETQQQDTTQEHSKISGDNVHSADQNTGATYVEEDLLDLSDGDEDNPTIDQVQAAMPELGEINEAAALPQISVTDESLSVAQEREGTTDYGNSFKQEGSLAHPDQGVQSRSNVEQDHGSVVGVENFLCEAEAHSQEVTKEQAADLAQADASLDKGSTVDNLNRPTDQAANSISEGSEESEGDSDEDEQDDVDYTGNTTVEYEDGRATEPLPIPVVVAYEGSELSLFECNATADNEEFFLSDESLVDESIHELLKHCRVVLGETISNENELEIYVPVLDLCVNESCIYNLTANFRHVMNTYVNLMKLDGVQEPEPLYMQLNVRTSFPGRLASLVQAVNAGKGLSHFSFQASEPNDNAAAFETEDADQTRLDSQDAQTHEPIQNQDHQDKNQGHELEHKTHELRGDATKAHVSSSPVTSASEQRLNNTVTDHHPQPGRKTEALPHNADESKRTEELALDQHTSDVSSETVAAENNNTVNAEPDKAQEEEPEPELDDLQDFLDDDQDTVEHGEGHDDHISTKDQTSAKIQSENESVKTHEDVNGSSKAPIQEQADLGNTEEQGEQIGEFDFDNLEEYEAAVESNDLNATNGGAGNEDADELFLFDEDIAAVETDVHNIEAGQAFKDFKDDLPATTATNTAEDTQTGDDAHTKQHENAKEQDRVDDDIFDEIDFDNEDEVPEFQESHDSKPEAQAPHLQTKRSWDEHNAGSADATDGQESKRVRS